MWWHLLLVGEGEGKLLGELVDNLLLLDLQHVLRVHLLLLQILQPPLQVVLQVLFL
jgi:hypothetical protein